MNSPYTIAIALIILLAGCRESGSPAPEAEDQSVPVINDQEYRDGEYLWRPSRITITLRDGDHYVIKGQYLFIEQALPKGEYGWGSFKLDLPDNWTVENLRLEGLAIRYEIQNGESISIQPPALNDLDFAILDGGSKSDSVMEALWRKHAIILKN